VDNKQNDVDSTARCQTASTANKLNTQPKREFPRDWHRSIAEDELANW